MIKMRCLRPVHLAEGDLIAGDLFLIGWKHDRIGGQLHPSSQIMHLNEEVRALEFQRKGIGTPVDDQATVEVPEVVQPPQIITIRTPNSETPFVPEDVAEATVPPLTESVIRRKGKKRG